MDEIKEEIIFLDCEIEDDDPDAPLGELYRMPQEPIVDEQVAVDEPTVEAEEPVEEEPIIEEITQEEAMDEPCDQPAEEIEKVQEEIAEQNVTVEEPVQEQNEVLEEEATQVEEQLIEEVVEEQVATDTVEEASEPQPEKTPDVDVWAVAPIAKKESQPAKKSAPKKTAEKSVDKDEQSTKKAPVKKKTGKTTEAQEPVVSTSDEEQPVAKKKSSPKKTAEKAQAPTQESTPIENKKAEAKKKVSTKEEIKEKVYVEGNPDAPHGKFVIKFTDKGHYVYKLYSANVRVVAIGAEAYASLPGAKGGCQSIMKIATAAPIEDLTLKNPVEHKFPKWQVYQDKKGEFRLRLYASNGNLVATTNDGYTTKDAAKKGIAAIARAAEGASIVRNDDLW